MKKAVIFLTIVLFAFACSDDFLELNPNSTANINDVYKNDKDFSDAVVGCYNILRQLYSDMWKFGDLRSDDSYHDHHAFPDRRVVDDFTMGSGEDILRDSWLRSYTLIARVNVILEKIEEVDPAMVPNKNQYIGEARFLRALCSFDLVRKFGDVPMVTKSLTVPESYKVPREDVNIIYNEVIIKDLLEAEKLLKASYTGADVGRATSGAAKALLGRVYLTIKDFQKAEAKLNEVTQMGYDLLPDFADLWDYSKSEHHMEYIFDIEYHEGINQGSGFTNTFIPNSVELRAFYKITGHSSEGNSPSLDLFNAFPEGDKRKEHTVQFGGFTDAEGNWITFPPNTSQSFTPKYMYEVKINYDSPINWKVIRYADVLLMLAEAMNENGKTGQALTMLDGIRTRAGLEVLRGLDKDAAREAIYKERRLELAMEGHRWFDLVRTGSAFQVMQSWGMREHNTLYPIPQAQIELVNNRDIMWQNPGYY